LRQPFNQDDVKDDYVPPSLFTVVELGEILPQAYAMWWYAKRDGTGRTLFRCAENQYVDANAFEADTVADARAKMLI
jgi:hypothetical protein